MRAITPGVIPQAIVWVGRRSESPGVTCRCSATPAGLAEIRSVSGLREHCDGAEVSDRSDHLEPGASHACTRSTVEAGKTWTDSKLISKKALTSQTWKPKT